VPGLLFTKWGNVGFQVEDSWYSRDVVLRIKVVIISQGGDVGPFEQRSHITCGLDPTLHNLATTIHDLQKPHVSSDLI
jgi:hypothetical protein